MELFLSFRTNIGNILNIKMSFSLLFIKEENIFSSIFRVDSIKYFRILSYR